MGDEQGMPADPFREGQPDWTQFAAGDAAFFAAHVAQGMSEAVALELTKTYLHFMLNLMLASQQAQPPAPQGQPEGM